MTTTTTSPLAAYEASKGLGHVQAETLRSIATTGEAPRKGLNANSRVLATLLDRSLIEHVSGSEYRLTAKGRLAVEGLAGKTFIVGSL